MTDDGLCVEFRNVTITISGCKTPKQAYDLLCEMLAAKHVSGSAEWATDTYVAYRTREEYEQAENDPKSTEELWPE